MNNTSIPIYELVNLCFVLFHRSESVSYISQKQYTIKNTYMLISNISAEKFETAREGEDEDTIEVGKIFHAQTVRGTKEL